MFSPMNLGDAPTTSHLSAASDAPRRQNALDLLLQRMETESDFPALSEAIGAINRIASSDTEGVNVLSNTILKDVALTNKLLRLANVAYYSQVGGGGISTISRAVVVLGFDAVRSIALSLILLDNLSNKAHAQLLKEEFVKTLFAGMLARELADRAQLRDAEEAFIGAMLHRLGHLLAMFYFPEETAEIGLAQTTERLTETQAALRTLGLSFESLGMGVARNWGFPDALVHSMKKLPDGRIRQAAHPADRLRMLAGFSNELCDVILNTPDTGRAQALAEMNKRFGDCLPMTQKQLAGLLEKSMQDITRFAQAVNVTLGQSTFAQQAAKWAGVVEPVDDSAAEAALEDSMLLAQAPAQPLAVEAEAPGAPRSSETIQAILTSGLQDVGSSLIDDNVPLNDILRMILETMYIGMGFSHVVLCIKDTRRNAMCGKFGFGDAVQALAAQFDFSLAGKPDVFLVALQNNADILIRDIDDAKIANRIPAWYRQRVAARTFVLFPISVKGKAVGLIYADRPDAGGIAIEERELSLLKSLRNQAVLAIRQAR